MEKQHSTSSFKWIEQKPNYQNCDMNRETEIDGNDGNHCMIRNKFAIWNDVNLS